MPSVLEILLHPDRRRPDPAPVRVDLRRVTYDHVVRRIVAEARQRVMIVRPEVGT